MNQLSKLLKRAFDITAACGMVDMLLLLLLRLEGASLASYVGFSCSVALTAAGSIDLSTALPIGLSIGLPVGLPVGLPIGMSTGFSTGLIVRAFLFLVAKARSNFAQHDCEFVSYGSTTSNVWTELVQMYDRGAGRGRDQVRQDSRLVSLGADLAGDTLLWRL